MNPPEMNVQNMIWKPKLIRLTSFPDPTVDDGATNNLYVDPSLIAGIYRGQNWRNYPLGFMEAGKTTVPLFVCTVIHCCYFQLFVSETTDQVAMLRDNALGYENKPKAI